MNIYTPFDADFQCECNGSIFRGNGQELTEIFSNYMKQLKKNGARAKPAGKIAKTRDPSWGYGFGGGMSFATPTRTPRTRTHNPRRVSKPVIFPKYGAIACMSRPFSSNHDFI